MHGKIRRRPGRGGLAGDDSARPEPRPVEAEERPLGHGPGKGEGKRVGFGRKVDDDLLFLRLDRDPDRRVDRPDLEVEGVQPALADPLAERDPDRPAEPSGRELEVEVDDVLPDRRERFGGHRGSPRRGTGLRSASHRRRDGSEGYPFSRRADASREPLNSPAWSFVRLTAKAVGKHPVSFRTRKLSPLAFRAVLKCASLREPRKAVSLRNLASGTA